jgi:hypothetical protein
MIMTNNVPETQNLRYEPVPQDVVDFCEKIKEDKFDHLLGANFLYVFDNKKKTVGGAIVFARVKILNDELKFLAMNDDGIIYDYIIYIDKNIWNALSFDDYHKERTRIIFHEFCHCVVDFTKKNPYGLRGHTIESFHEEIKDSQDDSFWKERISVIAESVYDPENQE